MPIIVETMANEVRQLMKESKLLRIFEMDNNDQIRIFNNGDIKTFDSNLNLLKFEYVEIEELPGLIRDLDAIISSKQRQVKQ